MFTPRDVGVDAARQGRTGRIWRVIAAPELAVPDDFRFRGRLVVITGPIFDTPPRRIRGLAIPSHFFKVVYSWDHTRCIGFLFPNREVAAANRWRYACSVAEVEEKTGLRFFRGLRWLSRRPDTTARDLDWWRG